MNDSSQRLPIKISIEPELPALSWLAQLRENAMTVFCGSRVERFEGGIVEGCWDGLFEAHGFKESANFFGSGVVVKGDTVTFVSSTHTLEALYFFEDNTGVTASNSHAFLVEFCKLNLDVSKPYGHRFATLVKGVDRYRSVIGKIRDGMLRRIAYANISSHDGVLTISDKAQSPSFASYAQYHQYLLETLRKTFDNGTSPYRRETWAPVTSCSSGYDSAACAALGAALGNIEAVTLSAGQNDQDLSLIHI